MIDSSKIKLAQEMAKKFEGQLSVVDQLINGIDLNGASDSEKECISKLKGIRGQIKTSVSNGDAGNLADLMMQTTKVMTCL